MKEVKGWNYSFGRQEGKEHSFFFFFWLRKKVVFGKKQTAKSSRLSRICTIFKCFAARSFRLYMVLIAFYMW
jgi:hypothetical protein